MDPYRSLGVMETTTPNSNNGKIKRKFEGCLNYVPKRYIVTFLTFLGTIVLYILRTNLSIAIIEMTSNKTIYNGNESYVQEAEFNWSSVEIGLIFSSFSWGYTLSFVGGLAAAKYGAVNVYGLGLAGTAILTIITPTLMRTHLVAYLVARSVEGILEGFTVACLSEIFLHWAPSHERTRLVSIAHSGIYIGAAINHPLSGFLASILGWKAIFYVTGGISLAWYIMWLRFVYNTPDEDRFILNEEKLYLKANTKLVPKDKINYPWRTMLTSKPLWAFMNEKFVVAWSISFIVHYLPLYIKDVHDMNVATIGLIAGIPSICSFLGLVMSSFVADYLRNSGILTIDKVHKSFIMTAQILSAVLLILAGRWQNYTGCILCFCLCRFFFGIAQSSYDVLPLDMFPRYVSFVTGMCFTFLNFGYMLNPLIMTTLVSHHTIVEWSTYFTVLSLFNVWGAVIFILFGSGELQPWAKLPAEKEQECVRAEEMRMVSTANNSK